MWCEDIRTSLVEKDGLHQRLTWSSICSYSAVWLSLFLRPFLFISPFFRHSPTDAVGDCALFVLKPLCCLLLKAVSLKVQQYRNLQPASPSFPSTRTILTSLFLIESSRCFLRSSFSVPIPTSPFHFHLEPLPAGEAYARSHSTDFTQDEHAHSHQTDKKGLKMRKINEHSCLWLTQTMIWFQSDEATSCGLMFAYLSLRWGKTWRRILVSWYLVVFLRKPGNVVLLSKSDLKKMEDSEELSIADSTKASALYIDPIFRPSAASWFFLSDLPHGNLKHPHRFPLRTKCCLNYLLLLFMFLFSQMNP